MAKKKDSRLTRAGVSGYNKPKRTPGHKTKSHMVLAQDGHQLKLIRFGQQGVRGAGKNPKTAKDKARKKSYYARHNAQDSSPSKMSARYWSHKVKWWDMAQPQQNQTALLTQAQLKELIKQQALACHNQ